MSCSGQMAQQSQVDLATEFWGRTEPFGLRKVLGFANNPEVVGGTSGGDNRLPANKDCGSLND